MKQRKGTATDDNDSSGVSLMSISTVHSEIQRGVGKCDEE